MFVLVLSFRYFRITYFAAPSVQRKTLFPVRHAHTAIRNGSSRNTLQRWPVGKCDKYNNKKIAVVLSCDVLHNDSAFSATRFGLADKPNGTDGLESWSHRIVRMDYVHDNTENAFEYNRNRTPAQLNIYLYLDRTNANARMCCVRMPYEIRQRQLIRECSYAMYLRYIRSQSTRALTNLYIKYCVLERFG